MRYRDYCLALPKEIEKLVDETSRRINELHSKIDFKMFGRSFLVGSGTAYASALASKQSFSSLTGWSGEWIRVMTAQEYAYINDKKEPEHGLSQVFMLASDFNENTVLDALAAAGKCKAGVIAITVENEKTERTSSDKTLILPKTSGKEVGEFINFQIALMLLALEIGRSNSLISDDEEKSIKDDMAEYLISCCEAALNQEEKIDSFAKEAKIRTNNLEMIGTGPDMAVAWMARNLVYKHIGTVCTVEETEDWLHVNFLQLEPEKYGSVMFISGNNPSAERSLRTAKYVEGIGRMAAAISDIDESGFPERMTVIKMPPAKQLWMQPLGTLLPFALLVEKMAEAK